MVAADADIENDPEGMRRHRETAKHTFRNLKTRKGATHRLIGRLRYVRTEMAFSVLAHNLNRTMGVRLLRQAMRT